MTKAELEYELEEVKDENRRLKQLVASYESEDWIDQEAEDEARVNRIVAERIAEEDRKNDERAAEDSDYAWELRQIRYMESRYDDMYGDW